MKLGTALLLGFVALSACDKVKMAASKVKGKVKGGPPAELVDKLVGPKYAGTIGTEVIEVSFQKTGDDLSAQAVYSMFGRPTVREDLKVTLKDDLTIKLRGTAHKRLVGSGNFTLDDMSGNVSADAVAISGQNRLPDGKMQPWKVSSQAKLAELDPPLDHKRAEKALVAGKWEGRVSDKPGKLKLKRKGAGYVVQMSFGGTKVSFDATLSESGALIAKPRERPTAQGLFIETFGAQLWPGYVLLSGGYGATVKQGFVEQSNSHRFAFKDLSAKAP